METINNSSAQGIREGRIQKLTDLIDMGVNPYPYTFDKTANAKTLQEKYKDLEAGVETEDVYSVAGRVMAMRNTGMFIDLMDSTGKIQIFSHKQNLPEEKLKLLEKDEIKKELLEKIGDLNKEEIKEYVEKL